MASPPPLTLTIGQKSYSSWSLRPWILLSALEIPFTESTLPVEGVGLNPALFGTSPSGLLPLLTTPTGLVWDSLAIAEYLYESYPCILPADKAARAHARCVAAEMHGGFPDLRGALSFNLRYRLPTPYPLSGKVAAQVSRIESIFRSCCEAYGGPYLFGPTFTLADAMYAPVVFRFFTYSITLPCPTAAAYMAHMLAHPAMVQWRQRALTESEPAIPHYDAHLVSLGGVREEAQ